ncbi:MAG: DNA repair protein RecN [Microbacteriaceae bacterium]|nr:DNA repair protein RecN [Microbacteriaceae bacterium]
MIIDITISDLGVISQATLPLGPGLTVVTGETGAGKTMVVTALGLLLGARADSARVRSGSQASWVEGRFSLGASPEVLARAVDLGAAMDDDELVLSREVQAEGRSRALVGGRSAPVSALSELAEELVVIHGQSDQIRLKSEAAQRDALDRFAGEGLKVALASYQEAFTRYKDLAHRLDELTTKAEQRRSEAEELRIALADIEAVSPEPGEDEVLKESITKLSNTEELRTGIAQAKAALSADESSMDAVDASGLLESGLRALERVASFDASLEGLRTQLADATYQVQEVSQALSGYAASLDTGSGLSLEDSHERLAAITGLIRKFGPTLAEVLTYSEEGSRRLLELDRDESTVDELAREVDSALSTTRERAAELSALRQAAAADLGDKVTAELSALAMPTATLHVRVESDQPLSSHGVDHVTVLLSAHPGSDPLPLGKGASGGELSRVMLALEVVIAGSDPVPTFVFDEVDAGVGGASALEIGRRLDRLAQTSQVIVVTHLAQVAAYANNHLLVVKDTDGQVTTSSVAVLEGEERVRELARMLGGMEDSHTALSHARELLEQTHSVSRR